jgi:nickel superoxide dismutase
VGRYARREYSKPGGISMKKTVVVAVFIALTAAIAQSAFAHCEVPCGIYDDRMRVAMIREHITTIEKAMKQIEELSNASPVNHNQVVRWTLNKEKHAEELQHIVQQYFMTQRVKPAEPGDKATYDKYVTQIALLHQILVNAMKSKQTADVKYVTKLRSLTDSFDESYFEGR